MAMVRKSVMLLAVLSAACAEAPQDMTVICWTPEPGDVMPEGKYYQSEEICVPVLQARSLPPQIQARAVERDRREGDSGSGSSGGGSSGGGWPVSSGAQDSPPSDVPVREFSETSDSGPSAGQEDSEGRVEASIIDRNTGRVSAISGDISSEAGDINGLRDRIFQQVNDRLNAND